MASLIAASLFYVLFTILCVSYGSPLDLSAKFCPNRNLPCQCGTPGATFHLPIKQCMNFYRWKPQCRPCIPINETALCDQYQYCLKCNADLDGCEECPAGRYGKWCRNECDCQNGGSCDMTSRCICPVGYQGNKCENAEVTSCPTLPLLEHGRITLAATAHFVCDQGFVLSGPSSRTWQEDGVWSNTQPKCVPSAECPQPTIPANSIIWSSSCERPFSGCTLSLQCKKGFILLGRGTMKCEETGKWSEDFAVCVPDGRPFFGEWKNQTGNFWRKLRTRISDGYPLSLVNPLSS